jgi:phage terminase large subunit-like protein
LTISPASVRVGAQQPRLLSVPRPHAPADAGQEAVELAAKAGLHLDPWQRLVLCEALRENARTWAAFEVGLIVPRQNGKGSVLEALELAALFLPDPDAPPPLILHSAHEFKTSAEHFRRMRDLIDGSPQFRSKVRIVRTAAGSESIELHSGARLRFVTRTGGSGRGFSADLIVIDEAYNLTAEAMAAVLPTMSARPNPQVWYTSSAGMTSSEQLARVRERGMAGGDPSLAFFEWSAEDGADLDDPDVWATANPALGIRIPEHFVAAERAALPPEQFARERLGMWADKDRRSSAVDPDRWSTLADPSAERGTAPAFAVATAPDRSWSAVAVAWRRPDGRSQVMLADYRPGAAWVADRVADLRSRWGGSVLVDTASRGLVPDASEPSTAAQAQAHNALADSVEAGTVRHGDEPALNTAVRAARWRPQGDSRVLDRKGSADISPLVAAALAVHGLTTAPATGGWMVSV